MEFIVQQNEKMQEGAFISFALYDTYRKNTAQKQ